MDSQASSQETEELVRLRAIERRVKIMFRGGNVWDQKRFANLRSLYRLTHGVSVEETTYDPCAIVIEDLRKALHED